MRILIIDDHPLYREVLRQYVEDYYPDAHVFEAGLVAEAMAVLVEYAAFDLIMLDMALPDMDGLAGLALIRAYAPHLPVVILSGIHDVETARRALAQGANGYVSKSVLESVLRTCTHKCSPAPVRAMSICSSTIKSCAWVRN